MSSPSLGTTIVERIAERESVDPLDLDQRLYDVVDVDALTDLVDNSNGNGQSSDVTVSFTFHDYIVTVENGADITITDPEPISDAGSHSEASSD